jgi:4-hydroxy-tetrahydrodipicolinate synthase
MSQFEWHGVYPAATTKFTPDDLLDVAEMERCFALQLAAGVHGLIVCGSLGEASTLDHREKIEVLRTALRVTAGSIPVICTIAEGSTRNAQALAEAAASEGAAGLMVLPGIPYRSDLRETLTHYQAVAAAGGLPMMIYNNPISYGVDITTAVLTEMASEPLFVAIKESSGDVGRIIRLHNEFGGRFKIFTGVDNLALESLAAGADGWVAGLVCAFPQETMALYNLLHAGRIDEARALYRWFHPLLDLDVSPKLVQNIKLAEALAIGSNDRCRPPRLPLAGDERARVEGIVRHALATRPKRASDLQDKAAK